MANLTFKCPKCHAELTYSAQNQNWTCEYCDGQFTLQQLETATEAANSEALGENIETERDLNQEEEAQAVTDDDSDFGVAQDQRDLVAYSCSHCHAEIITSRTTSATICPYCQHPIVIKNALVSEFSPELVIPFKVPREQADKAFKKFMKKPLTPKAFYSEVVVNKVQGVYVPFWLFDGDANGQLRCTGVKNTTSGNAQIRDYYHCERECAIQFNNVCVDASKKIDNDAMDSIEPYNLKEAKEFHHAYLSGYLAERYDENKETAYPRCKNRIEQSVQRFCEKDIQMSSLRDKQFAANVKMKKAKYALLPAWILYCTYKGKRYLFAMNGQTGKFIGNLPIDTAKAALFGLAGAMGGAFIGLILALL